MSPKQLSRIGFAWPWTCATHGPHASPLTARFFPGLFWWVNFFARPRDYWRVWRQSLRAGGKNCKIALLRKIRLLQNFGNFQSSRVSPLQSARLARRQVPKPFKLTGLHHFIGYLMDQSEGSDHEGKQAGRRSRSGSEGIDRWDKAGGQGSRGSEGSDHEGRQRQRSCRETGLGQRQNYRGSGSPTLRNKNCYSWRYLGKKNML